MFPCCIYLLHLVKYWKESFHLPIYIIGCNVQRLRARLFFCHDYELHTSRSPKNASFFILHLKCFLPIFIVLRWREKSLRSKKCWYPSHLPIFFSRGEIMCSCPFFETSVRVFMGILWCKGRQNGVKPLIKFALDFYTTFISQFFC